MNKFRQARKRLGLTQVQMGRVVRRDRKSVINYESGHNIPDGAWALVQHALIAGGHSLEFEGDVT